MSIEAMKLALEALESCDKGDWSTGHVIHPSYNEKAVADAIIDLRQALEQSTKQYIAVAWDTKEMWLKSWLPRLKEALNDVRNKENSSAEENLYELYVEMNQQTLSEKIDTLSEMQTEDLLSSTVAELLETRKRLSEVENILCRHQLEQSTEQEAVAKTVWIVGGDTFQCVCATSEDANRLIADLGINTPSLYPSVIEVPLLSYTSLPQPQEAVPLKPLTDEQIGDIAALFYAKWRGHEGFARAIEAAHGIGEKE